MNKGVKKLMYLIIFVLFFIAVFLYIIFSKEYSLGIYENYLLEHYPILAYEDAGYNNLIQESIVEQEER